MSSRQNANGSSNWWKSAVRCQDLNARFIAKTAAKSGSPERRGAGLAARLQQIGGRPGNRTVRGVVRHGRVSEKAGDCFGHRDRSVVEAVSRRCEKIQTRRVLVNADSFAGGQSARHVCDVL